jgi:hypothetical protein
MIKNDHEYLEVAMRAYDNPSCLTLEEFNKDLNQYIHIKKAVRRYHVDNSTLRKLVNQLVIYYNCFGTQGTDLLLYKTHETDVLEVLIPIIMYLGRGTTTVDTIRVTLNMKVIKQLSEL